MRNLITRPITMMKGNGTKTGRSHRLDLPYKTHPSGDNLKLSFCIANLTSITSVFRITSQLLRPDECPPEMQSSHHGRRPSCARCFLHLLSPPLLHFFYDCNPAFLPRFSFKFW
ncbi:hypothetical protein PVAP13_1NG312000 [Panicum virgatum]|uniref:Uncharacterized protein n=1 Tax=Panicum virgatum TaxID=38727 RepID=A0A8T0WRY8_PANVG|nr:hypothetical protein PVAP13_1NG312000 [Panicum virgatum]